MDTFNVVTANPFYPGYLILLGALILFALIVTIVQLAVAHKVKKGTDGRFVPLGLGIIIFLFGGFVGLGGAGAGEVNSQNAQLVHAIEAKGYTHVDYDGASTFVASDHGKYAVGTVIKHDAEHYTVVVK